MFEMFSIRHALAGVACAFALASGAQGAAAASYGGLLVFGDSQSDPGNNAAIIGKDTNQVITDNSYVPVFPYGSGQYSNGDVWAKPFAASIGLPGAGNSYLAGGGNYAFGGSRVSVDGSDASPVYPTSIKHVVEGVVATQSGSIPSDFLYVVTGGGNDARDAIQHAAGLLLADPSTDLTPFILNVAGTYAADVGSIVHTLESAGAQHLVVWNVPNLGLTPAVQSAGAGALGTGVANAMSQALAQALAGDANVKLFDIFGLLTDTVLSPGHNGFANVTDACGAAINACSPATALFWDGVHPTAAGHQFIAQRMYMTVVPLPQSAGLLLVGVVALVRVGRRRS